MIYYLNNAKKVAFSQAVEGAGGALEAIEGRVTGAAYKILKYQLDQLFSVTRIIKPRYHHLVFYVEDQRFARHR